MSAEVHVGDIGTVFEITVKDEDGVVVDISAATTKQFIFAKPGGTKVSKDASFVVNGTDGKLKYVTASGDLDESGDWQLQVYVVMPTGTWHSDIVLVSVCGNL
jgi:hypothetical protein